MFTTLLRPALRPTNSPIQHVRGALSLAVKWPKHEPNHLPVSPLRLRGMHKSDVSILTIITVFLNIAIYNVDKRITVK
jgi:hypothetical protein